MFIFPFYLYSLLYFFFIPNNIFPCELKQGKLAYFSFPVEFPSIDEIQLRAIMKAAQRKKRIIRQAELYTDTYTQLRQCSHVDKDSP